MSESQNLQSVNDKYVCVRPIIMPLNQPTSKMLGQCIAVLVNIYNNYWCL